MKVIKIKKRSVGEGDENFNKNFAYVHYFGLRIKIGIISHKDMTILVYTNRPELSIHEVVNAIESQKKATMREILDTLYSKNKVVAYFCGRSSFTTKIGDDDCEFYFNNEFVYYALSNIAKWPKYKRTKEKLKA